MTELRDCPDCGVAPGQRHQENCDVARCPFCGQQDAMCTVPSDEDVESFTVPVVESYACSNTGEPRVEGDMTTWTGRWPGEVECEELGWFARWTSYVDWVDGETVVSDVPTERVPVPNSGESLLCGPEHPHAHHDLNRLSLAAATGELLWDRQRQLFVRPGVIPEETQ